MKKSQLFFFILLVICNFSCQFVIKYVKKTVFLWVLGQAISPTLRDYLTTRYDLRARMNSKKIADHAAVLWGMCANLCDSPAGKKLNFWTTETPRPCIWQVLWPYSGPELTFCINRWNVHFLLPQTIILKIYWHLLLFYVYSRHSLKIIVVIATYGIVFLSNSNIW